MTVIIDECEHCEDVARVFHDEALFVQHMRAVHPEEFGEADEAAKKTPSGANAPYKIVPVGKKFAVVNNAGQTKATFDTRPKAADYLQALYANVKGAAKRASKVPFTGKAKDRVPARPKSKTATAEKAQCSSCERTFLDQAALAEHADAVHTFDDLRDMVNEAVREKYMVRGDYNAVPAIPSVWAWVRDMAADWVVFEIEKDGDCSLFKSAYSVTDNTVTLGDPVEVVRKTVYEPVPAEKENS